MYGWIWRHLPGNVLVKAVTSLLLVFAVVYLLFQHVFPWAEPLVPFGDATVDGGSTTGNPSPGAPADPHPSGSVPGSPAPGSGETSLNGAGVPSTVVSTLSFRVPNTGAPQV